MLNAITRAALGHRLLAILAALAIAAWGANAYLKLPIDAFPDVAPVQVMVAMKAQGLTPEELEARITAPIEIAMRGIPKLTRIRSTTRYSVTLITCEFAEGSDIYWARAQVTERLLSVADQMPAGVSGGLAPIVTPLAEVLMFTLSGGDLTTRQQRSLVDWTIRPALRGLTGVADVNVIGGFVRVFEVSPMPAALAARGITMAALSDALVNNNRNDGAGRVDDGEETLIVRVEGRLQTIEDIGAVVVASKASGVVRVSDVAQVRIGALPRNGVVTRDGQGEAVWGTVLSLRGADSRTVVKAVKKRLAELRPNLPEGVSIDVFYDRSELVSKAVWTVQKVLLEAIVLVVVLLLVFLGNLRAAIVVSIILPLAALATFGVMRLWGLSANIMSLGGLAIAIGLLVDCAVVVVENVEHRLSLEREANLARRLQITFEATSEVAMPLVSGVAIIVTVFLPLLSLEGLEGRLFGPVALTISFALIAALILSLTVVPVLSAALLRPGHEDEPWLVRKLGAGYTVLLKGAIHYPVIVVGFVVVGAVLTFFAASYIGQTFMPVMDEGTPIMTIRKHHTTSVETSAEIDLRVQRQIMAAVPEVTGVIARAGADELGIDPVGLNETDMYVTLAPKEKWRGKGFPWLLQQLRQVLDEMPGISFAFSQPIDMRVQEMIIGARGDVVVKIFGQSIPELNRLGAEIAQTISKTTGATDVFTLNNNGLRYLTTTIERTAIGRLGLNTVEIEDVLRAYVDGKQVGIVLEGVVRTPLVIRGDPSARRSATDFERLPIVTGDGKVVELSQVAKVNAEDGPIQVVREDTQRFATVVANVQGRDLVGFVSDIKAAVAHSVKLPTGYELQWGGQFENQQRASARLALVVPMSLAVVFLLLHLTFNSTRQAVLVLCNVPFAAIGGVLALWASGEFLSVPASVGFIALIGIAVLNGVVLISYINTVLAENSYTVRQAVLFGARRRMRPVILTATIAAFGLVPFLFATGPGSEIQRPLAIVVIGGLVTATALTLLFIPILYDRFGLSRKEARAHDAAVLARSIDDATVAAT